MKTVLSLILTFFMHSVAFAQNSSPSDINTFVIDIDPQTKTKLVISMHANQNLSLSARSLSELLKQLPDTGELNLMVASENNRSQIIDRTKTDLVKALKRGVKVNYLPFNTETVEIATDQKPQTEILAQIQPEDDARSKNKKNTVIRTRDVIRKYGSEIKNFQWKGLITASLITGAGASVMGPSWVMATDVPLNYQITSGMISALMLYWIPRKTGAITDTYKLGYEYLRTARFMIPNLVGADYEVPAPSKIGQGITTALGGVLFTYNAQSLLIGLNIGFENLAGMQEILLRNSIAIAAASTPWTITAQRLRESTQLSTNIISGLKSLQILGIGALSLSLPGVTETYLNGASLNWAEYVMLASGVSGLLGTQYGPRIINKVESSLWFRYLNRNVDFIVNLPENTFRHFRGRAFKNPYRSIPDLKRNFANRRCVRFLK